MFLRATRQSLSSGPEDCKRKAILLGGKQAPERKPQNPGGNYPHDPRDMKRDDYWKPYHFEREAKNSPAREKRNAWGKEKVVRYQPVGSFVTILLL
jgi:hypothetical protein